ncbi:hypothetical protein AYO47_06615 [Planctomyces sp. SCGC AG-212-M04]|nr:hypothetical protein AYO47_06615 [Planctomyces sp. SCGC AG-212-M04]
MIDRLFTTLVGGATIVSINFGRAGFARWLSVADNLEDNDEQESLCRFAGRRFAVLELACLRVATAGDPVAI